MNPESIVERFKIEGDVLDIQPFGDGLINSTFKVSTSAGNYILQRINHEIFKDVEVLSGNTRRTLSYLKSACQRDTLGIRSAPEIIETKDFKDYLCIDGMFYRMFSFLEATHTKPKLETKKQSRLLGEALATFHSDLKSASINEFKPVIPDFHNTPLRIGSLKTAIKQNSANRLSHVQSICEQLLTREEEMSEIVRKGMHGSLPLRVVHQDPKLSNVLFNTNDEIVSLIDLDTVMPGYLCYDFGDAVRSGMNTGAEDDTDLSNVGINLDLLEGFAFGYLSIAHSFITQEEVDSMAFGAKLMTYEQTVRFLTDYLNGDVYYTTKYSEHNRIRTEAQFKLLNEIDEQFDRMENFVKSTYEKLRITQ